MSIILPYKGKFPTIADDVFIAPGATIIGDVTIESGSSIWFGTVIRADVNYIKIGQNTNIQDGTVIHVTRKVGPTIIGSGVTIGHSVLLHACTLKDNCFIGMHATIMDDAVVDSGAMVAAGALVTPRKKVVNGQIWAGNPAKFLREMTDKEKQFINISAQNYINLSSEYKNNKNL